MIALDATYSAGRELTGVGVYAREILFGLADAHPEQSFRFCYRSQKFVRSLLTRLPANCRRALLDDRRGPPAGSWLFHGLNQRLPAMRGIPAVVTFHDLFVLSASYSTAEFRARFAAQARDAANRADRVVCVSHFTARQVRELLGVDPAKLRVIHHGVHRPQAPSPAPPREPMVLHVGAVQLRKNVLGLVEAFERHMPPGWRLVLAGSAGFGSQEILARIRRSPRSADIQITGYVPARSLEDFYARASLFVFPSFDEGFGIPVLEAMARGVPVIASNRSALPEVCGDAAWLVNPDRTEELGQTMLRLAQDEQAQKQLTALGERRVELFDWKKAVESTWNVYQELRAGL